eukprot:scaffold138288_cov69-Phaeocystis_antarctica.AAC.2
MTPARNLAMSPVVAAGGQPFETRARILKDERSHATGCLTLPGLPRNVSERVRSLEVAATRLATHL